MSWQRPSEEVVLTVTTKLKPWKHGALLKPVMQNVVPHCEGMQTHVDSSVVAVTENSVFQKRKNKTTSHCDLLVVPCLPTLSAQFSRF